MKIKSKDIVIVIAGKDKGKKGKVIRAFPKEDKVIVEGINMKKKHQKSRSRGTKGQVVEIALPIHVSNVMIEDSKTNKPSRIGYKIVNEKKIRISKKNGDEI
ncbi:50S ribosomal protein L24 [Patescibacteria group bacterium]|nr:50S ribosomal protein L24 [Patescibacteria group bacterium]MBU1246362.1 50S ribosomal protein L24 [Patescibacteria group bacterium]MBU1519076.1 50S ribosomal protein L24 [Patescibacteria group bacterium]MBU1730144.1 50S ribosomal protein L24 [Patescibacteria group bacterium]MBU1956407.1 50S ribosomal protein L24 [Patescibacteria group bacterium]